MYNVLAGDKPKVKKRVSFAPDVVDRGTNKEEYYQSQVKAMAARYELLGQEISSYEERKEKDNITNSGCGKPVKSRAGSNDTAVPESPLKFSEKSSVRTVKSVEKEETAHLQSCIARPSGICILHSLVFSF